MKIPDGLVTLLALIVGVIIAIGITLLLRREDKYAKGLKLQRKFDSIGSMGGMTKGNIISIVGEPRSVTNLGIGEILQWDELGFSISIYFDENGVFSSITNKSVKMDN